MAKSTTRIHTRLPVLRADRGLSRKALAEALGVHYQTIGYIERGEFIPSVEIALKVAEYFQVPVEALFSLTPFESLDAAALASGRAGRATQDDG